jgi:hypothetical protein
MSQLNLLKIKRAFYIMFGTIFDTTLIFLCGYLAYIIPSGSKMSFGAHCTVVFLLFIVFGFISLVIGAILEKMMGEKNFSFIMAPFSIEKDNKYVYDSNKGYYLAMVNDADNKLKLQIYKQNFFSLTELFEIDLIYCLSEDDIKNKIKTSFENLERENNFKKPKNKYKEQYAHFKNWDGYVDKQSRRDGILDKLLK